MFDSEGEKREIEAEAAYTAKIEEERGWNVEKRVEEEVKNSVSPDDKTQSPNII